MLDPEPARICCNFRQSIGVVVEILVILVCFVFGVAVIIVFAAVFALVIRLVVFFPISSSRSSWLTFAAVALRMITLAIPVF
jgi:hypothetical protein